MDLGVLSPDTAASKVTSPPHAPGSGGGGAAAPASADGKKASLDTVSREDLIVLVQKLNSRMKSSQRRHAGTPSLTITALPRSCLGRV